jgi:hypothetical protein
MWTSTANAKTIPFSCRPNQVLIGGWFNVARITSSMPEQSDSSSDLVEISKLNGSFKRNYGSLIGAYLYLRSVSAARGGSFFWTGLISIVCSAALNWLLRYLWGRLHIG